VSFDFPSVHVRCYAMLSLVSMVADSSLQLVSFFLLCTLFAESTDYSPVIDLLLRRVSQTPALAHAYFWASHSQTGPTQRLRLRFLAFNRTLLAMLDRRVADQLERDYRFASALCAVSHDERRRTALRALLDNLSASIKENPVCLPTSATHIVRSINVEKSRLMQSFAAPVFVSASGAVFNNFVLTNSHSQKGTIRKRKELPGHYCQIRRRFAPRYDLFSVWRHYEQLLDSQGPSVALVHLHLRFCGR
jgi:hypothetical protein